MRVNRVSAVAISLTWALFGLACLRFPRDCEKFFELPEKQQEAEFQTYSIDKQIDVYLCGAGMEPGELEPAFYFSIHGEEKIPVVLQRLKAEEYDTNQVHLLYLLSFMAVRGQLKGRQDVFRQLEAIVSRMRSPAIREDGEKELQEIKKNL